MPETVPEPVWKAIEDALEICCHMNIEVGPIVGKQFNDPISAMHELVTASEMSCFLAADLKTVREHGILRNAKEPTSLPDPEMDPRTPATLMWPFASQT